MANFVYNMLNAVYHFMRYNDNYLLMLMFCLWSVASLIQIKNEAQYDNQNFICGHAFGRETRFSLNIQCPIFCCWKSTSWIFKLGFQNVYNHHNHIFKYACIDISRVVWFRWNKNCSWSVFSPYNRLLY